MAAPLRPRLLTLDDWCALPMDSAGRTELAEGVLMMSPQPSSAHSNAALVLAMQLYAQVPAGLQVTPEMEVVLDSGSLPTIRIPDISVRIGDEDVARLDRRDVVLVVEIVSPGSRRIDHVLKRSEYQEAGIGHYWIIDLDDQVTLSALTLGDDGYEELVVTGEFLSDKPFPVRIDLAALSVSRPQ